MSKIFVYVYYTEMDGSLEGRRDPLAFHIQCVIYFSIENRKNVIFAVGNSF